MKKLLLIVAIVSVFASGASAGIVATFDNFTDWKNALPGGPTFYFEETFDGGGLHDAYLSVTQTGVTTPHGSYATGVWIDDLEGVASTIWNLNGGGHRTITAWGGTFNLDAGAPNTGLAVTFGPAGSTTIAAGTTGFWGVLTDTFFDSVTVTAQSGGSQHYTMDNMVYNPEPSTYTMLGFGLLGLIYAGRRVRK